MKTPIILRIFKGGTLLEVKQFDLDQIIFGHEGEVHIDLPDATISPVHALIELRDSGYYICDLGSTIGTTKNGKAILDEPISSGDQLGFGPFTVHFFVGVPKPKAPPTVTVPGANPTTPAALEAGAEKKKESNPNVGLSTTPQLWNVQTPPGGGAPPPAAPTNSNRTPPADKSNENMKSASVGAAAGMAVMTQTVPPPKLPDSVRSGGMATGVGSGGRKSSHQSGGGTFAPPSEIKDLREYLRPTKGPIVEVLTAWKERVLQTHHFVGNRVINLGPNSKCDIFVPAPYAQQTIPFLELQGGCRVFVPDSVSIETINSAGKSDLADLQRQGKATRQGIGNAVRLDQGDLVCLTFGDGGYHVFVRYVPAAPIPILASPVNLSAGELTAMVGSVILAILFSVYVSTMTPTEAPKPDEEIRVAQFIYNKTSTPTPTPKPPEPTPTPGPTPAAKTTPTPRPTPTPTPKKITVADKTQAAKSSTNSTAATAERPATKAAEIRPKPTVNKQKTMTSTNQGGAVKIGEKAGANAQSAKDVTKTGLLSAFGGQGVRSKLDQAYSGQGELLGMAGKSSGSSGQNENRAGNDIGSRFKDSGAGGKGTATEGISGVGTKGREGGTSAYGGVGLGGKGSVAIDAGGSEEVFDGSIDREAVRRVIRSILSQIKSCYERRLRANSALEGKVVIRFVIEEQGRVRKAETKNSTLNDREVEACVASRIREQRFPDPPAGTIAEVDYPFVFGMQK